MQLDQLKARRRGEARGRSKPACHVSLPQLEALQQRNFLFASFPLLAQFSAGTRTLPFFFSQCSQSGEGGAVLHIVVQTLSIIDLLWAQCTGWGGGRGSALGATVAGTENYLKT